MRIPTTRPARRTAFTLIELLVVIAIIAILVGLTAAGVMKFVVKGPELQTRSEISQMSAAVAQFKQQFKVDYMPSRIKLFKKRSQYGTTQLDKDSVFYLEKLFPSMSRQITSPWVSADPNVGIEWGPPGWVNGTELAGEQCLVFFLGGRQLAGPGVNGFSSNLGDPTSTGGTSIGPFYEFQSKRLAPGEGGFYVYKDPYGTSYAYFSAGKSRNAYNAAGDTRLVPTPGTLKPYMETAGKFFNPESFQIISAGRDKQFGVSPDATTPLTLPAAGVGFDDMSNFSDKILGALQ